MNTRIISKQKWLGDNGWLFLIAGVLSGLSTQFLLNGTSYNAPKIYDTTIWPGVILGIIIAYACWSEGKSRGLVLLIPILITTVSWIGAVEFAKQTMNKPLPEAVSFGLAGFLGSVGTALGVIATSANARKTLVMTLFATAIAGTVVAFLVPLLEKLFGDFLGWVFFPLWQTLVLTALIAGLRSGGDT